VVQLSKEKTKEKQKMTSGLVMGRKTTFIDGYAVQWFSQLSRTKMMIYVNIPNNKYVLISEMTLPYVAEDVKTIEIIAKEKIDEIEESITL
jgi:hypothetical protein